MVEDALAQIGFREVADIAVVTLALYAAIHWLRRANAGLAVFGALLLALIYLVALELRLTLTAWIFNGFFAVFVILLIVVLQQDLRRLFERVALWGVSRRKQSAVASRAIDRLCGAIDELARRNRGALIVLPGRDPVERYVRGGESLDGILGHSLLVSLFDPGSAGHDGAAIIEGDRVKRFAVHLPLSENFNELAMRGTRHSAALGLSEATDAVCLVVSEERGEISVARGGRLVGVDAEGLRREVATVLGSGGRNERRRPRLHGAHAAEVFTAALLSFALWTAFVSGEQASQRTFEVPVLVDNIDEDYTVEGVEPERVRVALGGLRRDLYLLSPTAVQVRLDATEAAVGQRTFRLNEFDVRRPPDLTVRDITPRNVRVTVARSQPKPVPVPKKPGTEP